MKPTFVIEPDPGGLGSKEKPASQGSGTVPSSLPLSPSPSAPSRDVGPGGSIPVEPSEPSPPPLLVLHDATPMGPTSGGSTLQAAPTSPMIITAHRRRLRPIPLVVAPIGVWFSDLRGTVVDPMQRRGFLWQGVAAGTLALGPGCRPHGSTEPSSEPLDLRLSRDTAAPLDEIEVTPSSPGTVVALDGLGRPYLRRAVTKPTRVTVGGALGRHTLLLLDEPFTALDRPGRHRLAEVLREERDRGLAVLLSSHDYDAVVSVTDRVVLLEAGRLRGEAQRGDDGDVLAYRDRVGQLGLMLAEGSEAAHA